MATTVVSKDMRERLMKKLDVRGPNECWVWLGAVNERGRARISVGGHTRLAMRVIYAVMVGPPGNFNVCHTCDVPLCGNPAHLFLGTHGDNMADMVAKGRGNARKADEATNRKLTSANIREARALIAAGETFSTVARRYGVWPTTIWKACRGLSWASVAEE